MPRVARVVFSWAVVALVSAACGARTGLPTGALACTGVPVGLVRQRPNLYFVLDRSTSMALGSARPTKWTVVRDDIADLIETLGADAEFGATVFPAVGGGQCAAGSEVLPLRVGDGLPSAAAGSTADAFLEATSGAPRGGTPTADTFLALAPVLRKLPGHTFAILATDGGPNCDSSLSCGADTCTLNIDSVSIPSAGGELTCTPGGPPDCCDPAVLGTDGPPNCLDGARTLSAVAALAAEGVPTFAIGVPGSEAYADLLDQVAQAGGTARRTAPFYYPVDTASSSSLVDALANIAARIAASCRLELEHPTPPGETNVVVEGHPVPQSGVNGWTLDAGVVTLLGSTCDTLQAEGQKVVVTEGCATRVR